MTRVELLSSDFSFTGKRLLLAVKEAGAGAMFAALIRGWQPKDGSLVIASTAAMIYFNGLPIQVIPDDLSDGMISELLKSTKPDRVVVGASIGHSIEKRLLVTAQANGMGVDVFVDHYWNLWQRFADPDTAKPLKYSPNRIYLPAFACMEYLLNHGFPQEQLGLFDHPLIGVSDFKRQENLSCNLRSNLAIPEDAIVVLFVSEYLFKTDLSWKWQQPCLEDFTDLLALLLKISTKLISERSVYVFVRPHPSEPQDRWDTLCNSITGSKWINAGDIAKEVLFSTANLVFGLNSMLLLEAAASGLPVYSYHSQLSDRAWWLSNIRPEVKELIHQDELIKVIENLINY